MTFVYDKAKVRARVVSKKPTATYTFHSMEDSELFEGVELKVPTKPLAPTATAARMVRGCYISLRTTFSADLKNCYYRIKVGKGTSDTGGIFGRSGEQGLPVLYYIDYPNAPSRGALRYHITKRKKSSKPSVGFTINCAVYDLEKDLIDMAKNIIGVSDLRDPFNLSGLTETFGWFKSRKKALKHAKKIAKAIASRNPTNLDHEKITVFNCIEGKEVT
tara:strand:+ start:60 stop:713 length:654 start_codon:yes stop_codon:yes gene_type:complete